MGMCFKSVKSYICFCMLKLSFFTFVSTILHIPKGTIICGPCILDMDNTVPLESYKKNKCNIWNHI